MQEECYLTFPLLTQSLPERRNLSRHSKTSILRALADEKARFRTALVLLTSMSSSISALG